MVIMDWNKFQNKKLILFPGLELSSIWVDFKNVLYFLPYLGKILVNLSLNFKIQNT